MHRQAALRGALAALAELGASPKQQQCRTATQLALSNTGVRAGSGGRQSISGVLATVFGATGFLGRYVVSTIGEQGGRAVCPHRCDDMDMQHLYPMGDLGNIVTLEDFSIRDDAMVRRTIAKSNVVINLIGQHTETWNYGFKEVHEEWPARLAQFCKEAGGVERLIHVSCLGADTASPSPRLASKARGDAALQAAFPDATLLRCGPLVGIEDRFYNDFALWRYANSGVPIVDGGANRVQPAYVVDVAEAIYRSLEFEDAKGSTYELAGPEVLTMRELALTICDELREDHKLAHVPTFFAAPAAALRARLAKMLPMHMMTRDLVFTPSGVAEGGVDRVVAPGAKTFADLHTQPHKTTSGIAIDHVRHWRKGGYAGGTNEPEHV